MSLLGWMLTLGILNSNPLSLNPNPTEPTPPTLNAHYAELRLEAYPKAFHHENPICQAPEQQELDPHIICSFGLGETLDH